MRKNLAAAGASLLMGATVAHAQGIQIAPAGMTPTILGAAQNFNGHVAVDIKAAGDSGKHGSVGMVDFAPGARTAWHTHPVGQLLVVTSGNGWVQEEGRLRREIRVGDVVWIEAGVKHWHGAARTNGMRHLAIAYVQDGKSADWKELVSDEQYNAR
ncbi:TetR family transcriptional regulator [Pseudoxanthomonas broegbernensis]|uniref:TetR family transcriptional regulator n=1 Tax=Pseudoxanthomonas broegbernensis TaxID=83619 RepID=A0A7V8GKF9_9GAMM|nr:cupin domain-containing protein [Pseudoxanthomonas broegbernensis]KAF1684957.1 TetR family transcriptional regulator [Pseudoxanthomonas broegbernensis]MBB6064859.1 quercetin dioxygenase-like cupin family protein [Pseudoxanthomonas broegbernensis]